MPRGIENPLSTLSFRGLGGPNRVLDHQHVLDHQIKALMNEKNVYHSQLKFRKDGFKKVMEDIFFLKPNPKKKIQRKKREHAS